MSYDILLIIIMDDFTGLFSRNSPEEKFLEVERYGQI